MLAFDLICGRVGFSGWKHLSCGSEKHLWKKSWRKRQKLFVELNFFLYNFKHKSSLYNKIINIYKLKMCVCIWIRKIVCVCVYSFRDGISFGEARGKKSFTSLLKKKGLRKRHNEKLLRSHKSWLLHHLFALWRISGKWRQRWFLQRLVRPSKPTDSSMRSWQQRVQMNELDSC